jgi:lysophospholipid acyltransferase (LPLAT)-like uncharacterized protein
VVHPETQKLLDTDTPVIFAVWHGQMYCVPCALPKHNTALLISPSNDGNIIAGLAKSLGFKHFIRGSSMEDGAQASREMIRALAKEHHSVMMTVDGPRGPFQVVKPGIIRVASIAQAPIIPVVPVSECYAAQLKKAWDKFDAPMFFSRVQVRLGEPMWVPRKASGVAMYDPTESTKVLQAKMDAMTQAALGYYTPDEVSESVAVPAQ